ncbi:DUF3861 domain-containing protein [Silvibacterium sp.]|uniref:DUF3861 domain-containing protein n=1 Tax=Silvibacterium sp. TaxID=1964179 RepID=UPI0039E31B3C
MYQYRITLEGLGALEGSTAVFETENHDDLFVVLGRMAGRLGLSEEETKSFGVGLKLFGEPILKHKDNALLQTMKPAFLEFMKTMKEQIIAQEKAAQEAEAAK